MNDFFHISLPDATDSDMEALEKLLGVKFQKIESEMIAAEKVDVCPLPIPSSRVEFDFNSNI
jgi:hypothetical protein